MGSPVSNILAEIYIQLFEELTIRQWMENGEISDYRRYLDDLIIIFYQNKINEELITNYLKNTHTYLEFKLTEEENNILGIFIHRKNNDLHLGIHIKPPKPDTTVQFTSNNPLDHKRAAYNFYMNRMITLAITEQAKQEKWNTILTVAKNNGFPLKIIRKLKKKVILKTQNVPPTL